MSKEDIEETISEYLQELKPGVFVIEDRPHVGVLVIHFDSVPWEKFQEFKPNFDDWLTGLKEELMGLNYIAHTWQITSEELKACIINIM